METTFPQRSWLHIPSLTRDGLIFVGLTVLVCLSIIFARETTGFSPLWPINGILLGIGCLVSQRQAKRIFVIGFSANIFGSYLAGEPHLMVWALAIINIIEIMIAWRPIRVQMREVKNLGDPRILLRFTIYGLILGPLVSAGLATTLMMSYDSSTEPFHNILTWWSGNALGMALFAPLVVALRPEAWGELKNALLEQQGLLRLAVLTSVCFWVFYWPPVGFLYLVFAPMVWVVFSMGFSGSPIGTLLICTIAIPSTIMGFGPVAALEPEVALRILLLQVYLGSFLLVTMPVGMVLDHRQKLLQILREQKKDLEHLSHHDPLTDLLNRRGLQNCIQPHFGEHGALIVLDVDHFKAYNDTYGHSEGDQCLQWLSQHIRNKMQSQGIAARQGGEEFAMILFGMGQTQAMTWAEKLRTDLFNEQRPHTGSPLGVVTVSLGVILVDDIEQLVGDQPWQQADQALYEAKHAGRNTVKFSEK